MGRIKNIENPIQYVKYNIYLCTAYNNQCPHTLGELSNTVVGVVDQSTVKHRKATLEEESRLSFLSLYSIPVASCSSGISNLTTFWLFKSDVTDPLTDFRGAKCLYNLPKEACSFNYQAC